MADTEQMARGYVERRFPHASLSEREKIVSDWVSKRQQAEGIASDFERRIGPLSGLRVLDAGSGNGGISIAFSGRGALVDGVDIESELVEIARAEALAGHATATFTLYDGTTLPFPDSTFDAALSVSVIEHVDQPARYLSELLRVVKPHGVLYLAFPNRLHPKETHTGLWGLSYLPHSLGSWYVRLMRRNPLEDNGLHFYSYWAILRLVRTARVSGHGTWEVVPEHGGTKNPVKRIFKYILRTCGVPHQALLPHVMLVLRVVK